MESEPPRHNVVDSQFDHGGSTIVVMCFGNKLDIRVDAEDLRGTVFSSQYNELLEPLQGDDDDNDAYETMCDWMLRPCFPILRDVASKTPRPLELTLQDFYFPLSFRVRLLISNDTMIARRTQETYLDEEWSLAVRNGQLPSFPNVPCFAASTITIVSDDRDDFGCEVPKRVRTQDGADCFFKPALDKSQYIREVQSHLRIAHAGLQDGLRISKLVGIVISDNMKMTLGLAFEWIPSISDLQSVKAKHQKEFHKQWEDQITATVMELHKHGITWGDVHPGNIIIDTEKNAWVVDFGGGWVEPFVTRKIHGSVDGDLSGIRNVFKHLAMSQACEPQSATIDADYNVLEDDASLDVKDIEHFK